jgi:hypothetical protein
VVPCQFLIAVHAKFDMLQTFFDQSDAFSEMDMPVWAMLAGTTTLVMFGAMCHSLMTFMQQLMPKSQVMTQPPTLVVQVVSQRTTNMPQMPHAVSQAVLQMVDRPAMVLRPRMTRAVLVLVGGLLVSS